MENYFESIKKWSFNGVDTIILREKDLSSEDFEKLYNDIVKVINPHCKLIINSKIDVYKKVNGYGLHLPYKEFLKYEKENNEVVGVSVHSVEEAINADKGGATYILASHIFPTKCKEGLEPKGIDFIKEIREKVSCKIIALGGITLENKDRVIEAGADKVAMMSCFF